MSERERMAMVIRDIRCLDQLTAGLTSLPALVRQEGALAVLKAGRAGAAFDLSSVSRSGMQRLHLSQDPMPSIETFRGQGRFQG